MVSPNQILSTLPAFQNSRSVLTGNQTVTDIIGGILDTHKKYRYDYNKFATCFIGKNNEDTARNIFDFLKKNTTYKIESEKLQLLKSPAAIVSTVNNDCKSYALFIGGVLDAISRISQDPINFCYRFAGYRLGETDPEHVFIVLNPGTKKEIWVDPVLSYFNERREPFFYYDYKPKDMGLYKLSGLPEDVLTTGGNAIIPGAGSLFASVLDLFSSSGAPNPNDWLGWTPGDVKQWTKNDGDSVRNEAVNIISYINAKGLDGITNSDGFGRARVTLQDIANKLQRAGFYDEAQVILTGNQNTSSSLQAQAGGGSKKNNLLLYGGIAAALFIGYKLLKK